MRTSSTSFASLSSSLSHPLQRDPCEYTRLLRSCSYPRPLLQIHAQIVAAGHHRNAFLVSKLISRYVDLPTIGIAYARQLFDESPHRDVLLWNVMIRGYATSGHPALSLSVYHQMRQSAVPAPNMHTYSFVLKACATLRDDKMGMTVHAHTVVVGTESNLFVGNALVAFYAKCGEVGDAGKVFDEMPVKDIVSWNSMTAGCTKNDRPREAISILHRMVRNGTASKPDRITLVSLLPACTQLAASQEGRWIHSYIVKNGIPVDDALASGLIGMYGSCGRLQAARKVFNKIPGRNLVVCNSMIQAYGTNGRFLEALEVFSMMLEAGVEPDDICFVCILSACSHAGMVQKGLEMFEMMDRYGVEKGQIHYACIVDLLGRSGKLDAAAKFIEGMPMEPSKDVWGALLGACRIYNQVELAEKAAKRLFILDPENAGRYLALANMYEDVGRLEDAARLRKAMQDRGIRRPLGCSMVEVEAEVYTFGVEDESHQMTDEIYGVLAQLQHFIEDKELVAAG